MNFCSSSGAGPPDQILQPVVGHRRLVQSVQGEPGGARFGLGEYRRREILGPGDLRRLRDEQLVPEALGGGERLIPYRGAVVGAGDRDRHPAVVRDQRDVDRLGVHREPVPAQPDRLAAVGVQVDPVPQRPARLLAGGLDPPHQLLGPDLVAEGTQLVGDRAQLRHHRIGDEVGVHLVERRQPGHPPMHADQDPLRRRHHPVGAAGPVVEQRLLARRERLVDVGTPGRQLGEEVVELAEAGLKVLDLQQQPTQLLVATLGGVGHRQRPGHRLAEQGELGREPGPALHRQQFAAAPVQGGPGPVHAAEHLADPGQDPGPHGGVGDLQRADHLGHHLQRLALLGEPLLHRGRVGGRADRAGVGDQPVHLGVVSGERVVAFQEADRPTRRSAAPRRGPAAPGTRSARRPRRGWRWRAR